MSSVYLFCLALGFGFTVLSAAFGALVGGGDSGGDAGALDSPDVSNDYGGAGHGEGETGGGSSGLDLPLLSPTVISCYLASFGGAGLLYQRLFGPERIWLHAPLAAGTGLAIGVALAWGIFKITRALEKSHVSRASDALAAPVEVTVSIPRDGLGEIAYVSAGTRQSMPARSDDGEEHKQGSSVRVIGVAQGIAKVVSPDRAHPLVAPVERAGLPAGEPVREPERARKRG